MLFLVDKNKEEFLIDSKVCEKWNIYFLIKYIKVINTILDNK